MRGLILFGVCVITFACNQNQKDQTKIKAKNRPLIFEIIPDSETQPELKSKLDALKEVVPNPQKRIIISNKDSINSFSYLSSVFETSKIDSIEFCGKIHKTSIKKRASANVLLIIYYNDALQAKKIMDVLENNYRDRDKFRAVEAIFKIGGMAFELENQLCVISYHTCGGNGTFESTRYFDSRISKEVFDGLPFERLLSKCGMGPFKRINE